MRILLIEDDKKLARLILHVLEEEQFNVDVVHDGNIGLELALRGVHELAIVDWMLPGRDGPSICRSIRSAQLPIAILMLTALGQIENRVTGLESGADDYLTKPFSFDEMIARIHALGRRFNPTAPDPWELRIGELVMDMRAHSLRRNDQIIQLTRTEWDLFEYLMRHRDQVLTRQMILDYVWSFQSDVQPELVDVYVSYLRQKLNKSGTPELIRTVRGVGYRLETKSRIKMFNRLRLRLTLLYFLFAVALVTFMVWGSYRLLDYYFIGSTDLALEYRMARELTSLRVDVPVSLQKAEADWLANHSRLLLNPNSIPVKSTIGGTNAGQENEPSDDNDEGSPAAETVQQELYDNSYEGDQAAIFVMPVDDTGKIIFNPNPANPPMSPDLQALNSALINGSDLRTVTLENGSKARLFTYHIPQGGFPYIQLGRAVSDQASVLNGFLMGMITLGGFSVIFLGIGAWWLAGRSIAPAQRAWESQRAFVANASHELRAPLTIMRASVEVAQRQTHSLTNHRLLADVLDECDSMNKLVEDLLILSRLDNQPLLMNLEPVDLTRFLVDMGGQIERMAGRKERNFKITSTSGVVIADPVRLQQVLLILLDNAFRYTPAGGTVELSAKPNGSRAEIIVSDTGVGIPPEHLEHVFEQFYKVDNSSGMEYRGSGLGLSIAKSLVEALSGTIRMESGIGKGTRAIVSLPVWSK